MVLPGGITGFYDRGDEPLTVIDLPTFRAHCHEAARRMGGRVVSLVNPHSAFTGNFAAAVLALPAGAIAVVVNAHHPIVAFADPRCEAGSALRFQDCPELAEVFRSFGVYQVIPAAELEQPPNSAILCELSGVERKQVAYWNPKRIGDVAFNWWD